METPVQQSFKIYLPIAVLVLLYLITRLTALTVYPMSSYEAMWIHWAQIVAQYPSEVIIAGNGGRQPMFTWLIAISLNLFSDPLVAGRLVSVLAGLASMTGLYFIGRDVFNQTAGFLAGLIYIVVPFAFLLDRLAIPVALLSAFSIWAFRWTLHIARETRPQGKAFKVLGILMGAAMLAQTQAILLFPILLIAFYFWQVYQRPEFWIRFGACIGIAVVMNLPVLLSGSGGLKYLFFPKNPWLSVISGPFGFKWHWKYLLSSLDDLRTIYLTYWTLPLALVMTASLVYLFRERQRVEKVLWLWILIAFLIFLLFGGHHLLYVYLLYGGHPISHVYLITVPPLVLLAAVACDRLAHFILITLRKLLGHPDHARTPQRAMALGGFMALVLFSGIAWDLTFLKNASNASRRPLEHLRYFEGQNSGHGVREAVQFLAKEAKAYRGKTGVPLPVLVPVVPGNPAEGITVYLRNHPDIRFVPVFWWPKSPRLMPTGVRFSHRPSIYQTSPVMRRETVLLRNAHFIFPHGVYSREKFLQENPRFQRVWGFQRSGTRDHITIFKNHPER